VHIEFTTCDVPAVLRECGPSVIVAQEVERSCCKGFQVKRRKDNAIAIVRDDLFVAAYIEGDSGYATGDGLYQGVGKVIRPGGVYKEVRCVIAIDHIFLSPDIILIMDLQVTEGSGVVQSALSYCQEIDLFGGEPVYMAEDPLQVGAAFPDIDPAEKPGAEHDRLFVWVQAELPAGRHLIPGRKYIGVEPIMDSENLFAFEDGALKGEVLQPTGWAYHGDIGIPVNRSFLS